MFRDPIERMRSGVPHRLSRTPDARLEAATRAIERGRYATQAPGARVPRRPAGPDPAVREVRRRSGGQYRRTLEFLGVDAGHRHDGFEQRRGTTQASKKQPLWDDLMDALRAVLEPEVARLAELTPEIDVSAGRTSPTCAARCAHRLTAGP